MGWIVGIAVACFVVWLLVVSPGFRKFALVGLVMIGLAIGFFFYIQSEKERRAATLLRASDIELSELRMGQSYGTYTVQGTVRNLSRTYTLSGFTLHVQAHDCPTEEITPDCDVIGDETVSVYVEVPPGQVRGFSDSVYFSNMPKARNFEWSYALQGVRADVD